MVGHGGSSASSYLADPTFPIPSHCASIVVTSTVRVNGSVYLAMFQTWLKIALIKIILSPTNNIKANIVLLIWNSLHDLSLYVNPIPPIPCNSLSQLGDVRRFALSYECLSTSEVAHTPGKIEYKVKNKRMITSLLQFLFWIIGL